MNYKVASAKNIATLLFLFSSQSEALDLGKIAKIKAGAESFSKVGFNNKPINTNKGLYPTETFMTIMAYMQVDFTELLPKSATANGHHLDGSLGGWGGAVIYDTTKD
ncbi:outer membrane family protein, partial [Helicobacter pylori]